MIVIGELINSTRKEVLDACEGRDAELIKDLTLKQVEAGANFIDVNAGAFVDDEAEHLLWLMETVQGVTDVPLAIDSADPEVIEEALKAHKNGIPLINSITAEQEKFDAIAPLVKKYDAKVVALCLDDTGMPNTADDRVRIAKSLVDQFNKLGIPLENVFLDPLVKPVSVDQTFGNEVLDSLEEINKLYPEIHTTAGLSNISFGLPIRKILNQAFFVMCIDRGMDSVIIDPLDSGIMSLMYAAETVAGKDPKCMNYLKAVRAGHVKA